MAPLHFILLIDAFSAVVAFVSDCVHGYYLMYVVAAVNAIRTGFTDFGLLNGLMF